MKKLLSALFVLALCSSVAMASVPDPVNSSVAPIFNNGLVLCPDGNFPTPHPSGVITVTVKNSANNPIAGAVIEVDFHSDIAICDSFFAQFPVLTNASGEAQVVLAAAGCVNNVTNAAVIRANGIPIETVRNLKSPANGSASENAPLQNVGSAALVPFANSWLGAEPVFHCADYDNSGDMGSPDLVIFATAFLRAYGCTW